MANTKRLVLRIASYLGTAVVLLSVLLTLIAWPSIGKSPDDQEKAAFDHSPQWDGTTFVNAQPTWIDNSSAMKQMFSKVENVQPASTIPVHRTQPAELIARYASGLRVTWFGHSSTLIQIAGKNVLIDPLWSDRPSPIPGIGPKRWYAPPIALDQLPPIDAVLISHDHYDHLDRQSIEGLRDGHARFIVPLGTGATLQGWGIPKARIIELDWWDGVEIGSVRVVATPARHQSGRLNPQSDHALWSGYALLSPRHRVYYSGDTGYLPSLKDIGERLGPFDLALVDAGQYNAAWPDVHLGPEQAVEAAVQARAQRVLPVHWGLISLAHHAWTEPAERVRQAALCAGIPVSLPRPGEPVEPTLGGHETPWWPHLTIKSGQDDPVQSTLGGEPGKHFDANPCDTAGTRVGLTSQN